LLNFDLLTLNDMQRLLVTLSDSANLTSFKSSLLAMKEVEGVEYVSSGPEADWKSRLHLPGNSLTKEQRAELVDDMDNESDEGISSEELTEKLNEHFRDKWGAKLI
jgi:hypothetical protein